MDAMESADLQATSEITELRAQIAGLEESLSRRTREMVALHEISLEINRQPNLAALLQAIVEKAAGLLNARMGGLYLIQPDGETLKLTVGHNLPEGSLGITLKLGEGLSGRVAQTGQLLVVPDYRVWEGRARVYEGTPFRRVVGVPLKRGDKIIGVINVSDDHRSGWFDDAEIRLVSLFADQAAIVVDKVRLWEEAQHDIAERQRAEQIQSSLYRISEAVHTARSLDELYRSIHTIIADLMPAHNFGIALYDATSDMIRFPYFIDESYLRTAPPPRRRSHGLVEYVLRTGEPLLGSTDEIKALLAREQLQPGGAAAVSWLGVPLKWQGKTIGVAIVQTYTPGEHLTEEHEHILTFVSTQIVMAIQRKQVERLQASLYRISEAALTSPTLDELYRSIHGIISALMPAQNFYIALYDGATDTLSFPYFKDEAEPEWPVPARQHGTGLTEYVLRLGEPWLGNTAMISDLLAQGVVDREPVGPLAVDWLGVPLKAEDKIIGLIAVQSYSDHIRLTDEHKDLLVFVSAQVAMAIQRKRAEEALHDSEQRYHDLFDGARRQAQELALLDRVRTALTRELDLDALFRTVVTAIAETFGYALVSLYLLDGDELVQQHQIGYDYGLDRISIASGVTGRVVRTGQAVFLEDVRTDPTFLMAMDGIVSEVCVPLLDQGQVVGILNVESIHGVKLTEADLRLMTALSEHIGLAISRARLYTQARENAARLTAAFESLPFDFWVTDRAGRYVMQNSRHVRKWGNRIGQYFAETHINETILRHWHAQHERVLSGEMFDAETRYDDEAEPRWYYEIVAPVRNGDRIDGTLGVSVDVTDRHRAEEALRDSEERYRLLFENNPHPMWAYDLETLAFLAVNDAALEHYGYSREEFLHMTIADIRPSEDVSALLASMARTTETVNLCGVWRHRKKDGTLIDVEISSHTLTLDGRPARIVLATDVTEHRRAEEALRRAQKMESLGVLAGGIAHDFNNLLVAMLGQTSLALGQLPAGSPARQPIEKAVSAARRAADLTRQLLAYSGRGQFERRPIQLNHLIQENLHLFEVAVPKNVLLRSELTDPLPLIMGDAGQIQQVVMNLIINAAEAIGQAAGQVVVRTRPYLLTPDKAALWQLDEANLTPSPYVLLEVEDNGCGMDQETSSKIFDPFFSTKFTGRGLGLAAVLGIVRGHDGGLRVKSELNVGTLFELVFPSEDVTTSETLAPAIVQEADMLRQRILVIDDEEPVRDAVTDILDLEGLSVLTAPDGQTGIELYRARQAEIDLIILDLSMPGLTGEETFRELRQINPQVRIMLSSGYSHDEVISRFAGQREVAFIQKPYDAGQLVAEVKRQLALPQS